MGCLEKIFGTLLGLFSCFTGIYLLFFDTSSDFSTADCVLVIVSSLLWTIMNYCTDYEDYESEFNQLFQSPITTLIGKWIILMLIIGVISWVGVGLLMGFSNYSVFLL